MVADRYTVRHARDLARASRQVARMSAPQLDNSSIEDGSIDAYDDTGTLVNVIGKQFDGTHVAASVGGPTPPAPVAPTITGGPAGVTVQWTGEWVDGEMAPMDLARIDVAVFSDAATDPLTVRPAASIVSQGWGGASVNLPDGTYYAVLIARTQSGKFAVSALSGPADVFLPPAEPPTPVAPESSPTPTVTGGPGSVALTWPAVPDAGDAGVRYDVQDSEVGADVWTTLGSTGSTGWFITDANGLRDYRVWARSGDQYAPAASPAVTGGPDKDAESILIANEFYAVDGVHVGDSSGPGFDFDTQAGFFQRGWGGAPRVGFPMDPSQPNVMDSDLVTRGFTALGRASFRGDEIEFSRNSKVTLEVGTTRPSSSLGGFAGASWEPLPALGKIPSTARGGWRDTDGSWLFTLPPTTASGKPRILRVSSTGVQTTTTPAGLPATTSSANYYADHNGVVRIGTDYYLSLNRITAKGSFGSPDTTENRLYVLNSSFAAVRTWSLDTQTAFYDYNIASVATDGTSIYTLGKIPASDPLRSRIRSWSTTGSLRGTVDLGAAYPPAFLGPGPGTQFTAGAHDFGSFRYVIAGFTSLNSAGAVQSAEGFAASPSGSRFGWDGLRFVVWGESGLAYRSSARTTSLELRAAYTWYDSDTSGGVHETQVSPVRSITLPARAGAYRLTAAPPNDDGTPDAPDSSRLYVGRTDATLRLQGAFVNEIVISDPNLDTGALPPTVNTFPDGTPAVLQSRSGAAGISGDSRMWAPDPLLPTDAVNLRTLDAGGSLAHGIYGSTISTDLSSSSYGGVNWNVVDSQLRVSRIDGNKSLRIDERGVYSVAAGGYVNRNGSGSPARYMRISKNGALAQRMSEDLPRTGIDMSLARTMALEVGDVITPEFYVTDQTGNVLGLFFAVTKIGNW